MADLQDFAVVEEPIAFGIGFLVLALVAFTGGAADSIVTVAHEGGHMLSALLSGRGVRGFDLSEGKEARGSRGLPEFYQVVEPGEPGGDRQHRRPHACSSPRTTALSTPDATCSAIG